MALKDWKKTRNDKSRQVWKNDKTKRVISVEKEDSISKYVYAVFSGFENKEVNLTKYFKTKSQAINFAKKYMMTH